MFPSERTTDFPSAMGLLDFPFHLLPLGQLDNSCPYLTREREIKTEQNKTLEAVAFFGDLLVTNFSLASNKGVMCFFISNLCMVYLKVNLLLSVCV